MSAGVQHAWMDQGGTFTDVVTVDAYGRWEVRKVLSDRADLAALARGAPDVRRGTTVATNALLERSFGPVLLVTTAGFEDALDFGDQVRPELFARTVARVKPIGAAVVAPVGRLGADGRVVEPFQLEALEAELRRVDPTGASPVAISIVHGPRAPEVVKAIADRCRRSGAEGIATGPDVAPTASFLERTRTAVLDAALTPLLPRIPGKWMCSDGGLADHDSPQWRGCRAVLSGPAGGVVATAAHARRLGRSVGFIGLDMGGTSTDICRVAPDGQVGMVDHLVVDGLRVSTPAVRVDTIAAGGGSVLGAQGGTFAVGPDSAGSDPGPACYGRGGPLALTDTEAVLGRLPDFPLVAGPDRNAPLDLAAARTGLRTLAPHQSVEVTADGFRRVAHSRMAGAVRRVCAEEAADPARHILVAFGGAGPAHACGVARELGIAEVHVPLLAGVWSAVGIGQARARQDRQAPVSSTLVVALARARCGATIEGVERLSVRLRHVGTAGTVELVVDADQLRRADAESTFNAGDGGVGRLLVGGALRQRFDARYRALHGFSRPELPVEAVFVRSVVEAVADDAAGVQLDAPVGELDGVRAWFAGRWRDVPLVRVGSAPVSDVVGPAICILPGATLVVEPGWVAEHAGDHMVLRDHRPAMPSLGTARHPVHTAVFGARLMGVAEAMGEGLARMARSVSIRERRDFSCAIFDAQGRLAVNAPHVPVHLGAMGETVRVLLRTRGAVLRPGQAWMTNDPYAGGSHLPDITVMRAVFDEDGVLLAVVACRGHHVDVGGTHPGSMPPDATSIEEEGRVIPLRMIVDAAGAVVLPDLTGCRQPDDVQADLLAQVASCTVGVAALEALARSEGVAVIRAQLKHLQAVASEAVGEVLRGRSGVCEASTTLDDGTPISVTVDFGDDGSAVSVHVDGPAHPGNLNAPSAVARAAVLYVLRCMVGAPIPLNEGVLERVRVTVNTGGLFDPCAPRAVAGGNVETSQVLVDTLFQALGLGAASQGTMNNLTVGTQAGAFYETIGGGSGGTPEGPGASAVQVHMTNTRSTDVEVLEQRFPVRLEQMSRRRGSGGRGLHAGGDGLTKIWRFLAPATVAILAGRRQAGPPGLEGGHRGLPGRDWRDVGQGWEACPKVWQAEVGDRLRIDTPGGGGWGPPD